MAASPRQPPALVFAPLSLEKFAVRRLSLPGVRVIRCGMGRARAAKSLQRVGPLRPRCVLVLGFCGGLQESLSPGDLVVATSVMSETTRVDCFDAEWMVETLRDAGAHVTKGAVWSSERLVRGAERLRLRDRGAVAVDMESAWLAPRPGVPFIVIRAVVDTPLRELYRPWNTLTGGIRAYRSLSLIGRFGRGWIARNSGRTASPT